MLTHHIADALKFSGNAVRVGCGLTCCSNRLGTERSFRECIVRLMRGLTLGHKGGKACDGRFGACLCNWAGLFDRAHHFGFGSALVCNGCGGGRFHLCCRRFGDFGDRFCGHGQQACWVSAQNKGVFIAMGFDAARDFTLSDTGQHFGVRAWRLGTKIAVIGSKIAKILRNGFHCSERIVESLQCARECAIGDGEDLVRVNHVLARHVIL